MGDEGGAIAFIVEAPDRALLGGLEIRQPPHRAALDEIGHGVEPLDRDPGKAVHHHPLGG